MAFQELVVLLPCQGLEDFPSRATGPDAPSLLAAWTAAWHPAPLARLGKPPRWAPAHDPPTSSQPTIYLVPLPSQPLLTRETTEKLERAGGLIVPVGTDRPALLDELARLIPNSASTSVATPTSTPWDADFLALGYAYLQVELLTRQMRYGSTLDHFQFHRELLDAARLATGTPPTADGDTVGDADGDADTDDASHGAADQRPAEGEGAEGEGEVAPAGDSVDGRVRGHLRRCFDLLAQQRDHYYPVDVFVTDVTLVEPTICERLDAQLQQPTPQNLMLTGECLEYLAEHAPQTLQRLRDALIAGQVDLVSCGQHADSVPLAPPSTLLADFRWGQQTFRQILDHSPSIYGRRVAGWSPLIPKLIEGFGFRGAWLSTLDGSRVPSSAKGKTMWEGQGGASIATCARPPLDARQTETFLGWSAELSQAMDHEHVATRTLVHWPGDTSPYYDDWLRVAQWSPVLGKLVTWNTFFSHSADSGSWDMFTADEFDVIGHAPGSSAGPLTASLRWWQAWLDHYVLRSIAALGELLQVVPTEDREGCSDDQTWWRKTYPQLISAEGPPAEPSKSSGEAAISRVAAAVAAGCGLRTTQFEPHHVATTAIPAGCQSVGLINPHGWPTRVFLQGGPARSSLTGEGTVYATTQLPDRFQACCDAPAMGFAIGVVDQPPPASGAPPASIGEGLLLRNEYLEAHVDPATGGVRQIYDYQVRGNLCSQQLAVRFPVAGRSGGKDAANYTRMEAESVDLVESSPLRGVIRSTGRLVLDGANRASQTVGRFTQLVTLIRGRRLLEFDVQLELDERLSGDPWETYAAMRWAWRDETAELWRSVHFGRQQTEQDRFAAPLFCEIRHEPSRLTIFPAGLPWHVRTGARQLDTLLQVPGDQPSRLRLALGLGVEYPVREALAWLAPPLAVGLDQPVAAARGWLFHLDAKNVVPLDWEAVRDSAGTAGLRIHLQETEGRYASTQLRSARPVVSARRLAFSGEEQRQLTVQDDAVELHLAPLDWIVVELLWRDLAS